MQIKGQKNFPSSEASFQISIFFFVITRIIALLFSYNVLSDIIFYYGDYNKFFYSLIPYVHFDFEYQPLSLIPIFASGIFSNTSNIGNYYLTFITLMMVVDIFNLYLSIQLGKKYNLDRRSMGFMILSYSLLSLLLFKLIYHRLDIVVTTFILLSALAFLNKKKGLLYLNSYLGFFYKIISAFSLPAAIIINEHHKGISTRTYIKKISTESLKFLFYLVATMIVIQIIANEYIYSLLYHTKRGIQIESIYGSSALFFNFLTNKISQIEFNYGSFNIVTNKYLEVLAKYLGFVILASFYLFLFISTLKNRINRSDFLEISLLIFLIFISFQRVLSPQFLIWIIPLFSVYLSINKSNFNFIIVCLIYLITAIIFYPNYHSLTNQEPILINLLFIRNLLLIFITFRIFNNLFKKTNDR